MDTLLNLSKYHRAPDNPEAMGEIKGPEGKSLLTLFFRAHRDIIADIGFQAAPACPRDLLEMEAALCSLAEGKAVMAAELLGPADIFQALSIEAPSDAQFYNALLAVLSLKNALESYAEYRRREKRQR